MKIKFEDIVRKIESLHKELLNSLAPELIDKASEDQFLDVKLLINGVETEPLFYNVLLSNIENYIESEAKEIVLEKLEDAQKETEKLQKAISRATRNIIDEFNLEGEE